MNYLCLTPIPSHMTSRVSPHYKVLRKLDNAIDYLSIHTKYIYIIYTYIHIYKYIYIYIYIYIYMFHFFGLLTYSLFLFILFTLFLVFIYTHRYSIFTLYVTYILHVIMYLCTTICIMWSYIQSYLNAALHEIVYAEAVARTCSVKEVFLQISQNSQKNTCASISFLIKLQAWNL